MGSSRLVEEAFAASRPPDQATPSGGSPLPVSRPPLPAADAPVSTAPAVRLGPGLPAAWLQEPGGGPAGTEPSFHSCTDPVAGGRAASPGAEPLGPGSQPAPCCSPEDRRPSAVQGPEMSRPRCRVSGWVARGLSPSSSWKVPSIIHWSFFLLFSLLFLSEAVT